MWSLFVQAAWKVTLASLILGAGLPALFALGVRETVVATGSKPGEPVRAAGLHRVLGIVCFAVVVIAVVVGITIIVASGLGKEVTFDHIFPTIRDKG